MVRGSGNTIHGSSLGGSPVSHALLSCLTDEPWGRGGGGGERRTIQENNFSPLFREGACWGMRGGHIPPVPQQHLA